MFKQPIDVICLNETFCDSSISDSEINLPDYSFVRRDRNRHGGGIAIFFNTLFQATAHIGTNIKKYSIVKHARKKLFHMHRDKAS